MTVSPSTRRKTSTDVYRIGPCELSKPVADSFAGAVSGAIARFVISPLDVVKIRFQVQVEPLACFSFQQRNYSAIAGSKYTGLVQAFKLILKEEGILGFWRGIVPAQLLVMPYCAIQFAVYQKYKAIVTGSSEQDLSSVHLTPSQSFVGGALAGAAATIGSYPFDLLRTILASQGEPRVYNTMLDACKSIYRTRGIPGFYSGVSITLVEILPYAGLQFGFYDFFKSRLMLMHAEPGSRRSREAESSGSAPSSRLRAWEEFCVGLAAGTIAKVATHPMDVVKKRFQIEGLMRDARYGARIQPHAYKNMADALWKIGQAEGLQGLYKGVLPSVIKAAPSAAVTFMMYEVVIRWMRSQESK